MAGKNGYELDDLMKMCFKCTLPPDACDNDNACPYMIATRDKPSHRAKSPDIQHTCGFPEKNIEDSE